MSQSLRQLTVWAGFAALQATAYGGNAVSPEAVAVSKAAQAVVESVEQSQALFGDKSQAISKLMALADEYAHSDEVEVNGCALFMAKQFIRALPDSVALPEFSVEPDGSLSLDWIQSRKQLFSLSMGASNRIPYAWLDGTNSGHGVENFDGQQVPKRLVDGILAILKHGDASFRTS